MKFIPSARTKWHHPSTAHVVWTTRDGQYLFFPVNHRDYPIVVISAAKSAWYVRPTEHCVAHLTVTITHTRTHTTQYPLDIPDPPPVVTTHIERVPMRSVSFPTLLEAQRAASQIVLEHMRQKIMLANPLRSL